jgi:uncharacterized membrane protein YvlD (DUF360 family)
MSFAPGFAMGGVAPQFVVEGGGVFMSFAFAAASGAVVPKIVCDAVGMTIRNVLVILVFALCFGFDFGLFVLCSFINDLKMS